MNLGCVLSRSEIKIIKLHVNILHVDVVVQITNQLLSKVIFIEILCLCMQYLVLRLKDASGEGSF
jgi:hypothetical protein